MSRDHITAHWQSPVFENCITVVAEYKGRLFASGSGFILNQNYAVTAAHVIDDFKKQYLKKHFNDASQDLMPFSLTIHQILFGQESIFFWRVEKVSICQVTDIAILHIKSMSRGTDVYEFNFPTLQLIPPKKGDKIFAIGFPYPKAKKFRGTTVLNFNLEISEGKVVEVYGEKRDSVFMPFPSFCTEARFKPSMSGGPVFTDENRICGLVCSSFSFETDDAVSFAASLWPIMGVQPALTFVPPDQSSFSLLDCAIAGSIKALGHEFIELDVKNGIVHSCRLKLPVSVV